MVDTDSTMLAFGFVGTDPIPYSLVDSFTVQVIGIRGWFILFLYPKPGYAALYFGEKG